ncbi:MAG: TolC family protein [Planctomycetaceae bacterium]|nr:TolC family protein [Planctomycetaceae bacterium]
MAAPPLDGELPPVPNINPWNGSPPGPAAVESLDDAWQVALDVDQRIAASRWNANSASSTLAAAEAERFPALKMGGTYYALSDQPTFSATLPAPLSSSIEMPFLNSSGVGFQAMVNQPIYTFGRITHGINAASEGVKANEADCERTVLDVKMNVADIYVSVLRVYRLIEVVDSKVVSLESHARDVGGFFEKGLVPKNDLLAAQVALANARQEALQIHNMLQVANAAYNRALGRTLDSPVHLAEVQTKEFPNDINQLTQQAMQLRPELAALSSQSRALREQAASVRAKKAPQIGVQGGYAYLENDYVDPNGMAVVGVGLQWTPIDSGRISNQSAALNEKAEATVRLFRDAQSMVALEVRQKWLDLQTALHRVEAVRPATAQADENLRVARDRYQHQVGTNTEVLDAETLRLQAYTNFYNSSYEAVLADLRLRRAVGNL